MHMSHKKAVRLVKTARGQLDGVIKMIEEDQYCIDISNQILAAIAILKKTNQELIMEHLKHCVRDASGDEEVFKQKMDEIENVMERMGK